MRNKKQRLEVVIEERCMRTAVLSEFFPTPDQRIQFDQFASL